MKQYPKNFRYKKCHKPDDRFLFLDEQKEFFPIYGNFALKSLEPGSLLIGRLRQQGVV